MGGLLPLAVLHELVDVAGQCGVLDATNRDFLLAALSPAVRSTLIDCATPRDQALSDLIALNQHADPPPAIAAWLGAAARLTQDPESRLIFLRRALDAGDRWWADPSRSGPARVEPSRLTPGTLFDRRFELIEVLSDRVFSMVWLARDARTRQRVALKIIKHLLDARSRRRLLRGAVHLCRMRHPNLVRVFDFCEPESERPFYYWMEYLAGGDLYQAVIDRRLAVQPAIEAVLGAAEGLAASHDEGVWHRDVKPDNILLGENGRSRLADFDLLHSAGGSEDTGRLISPAFAAPEALADLKLADHRADIFGLGRSVQFCLFVDQRSDLEAADLGSQWARAAMGGLGAGALRCATELEAVLTRATDPDPERRYTSVRDFIHDMRDALDETEARLGRRFVLDALSSESAGRRTYQGFDTRTLDPDGRPVPVTIERFDRSMSDRIDAAFAEGRWSSVELGLSHAGIEPVLARGLDHHGCYWQVTERRDDPMPLLLAADGCFDATPNPFEALAWVGQRASEVVHAVAHAHQRGIVHRRVALAHVSVSRGHSVLSGWTLATRRDDSRQTCAARGDIQALGHLLGELAIQAKGLSGRTADLYPWPEACQAARQAVDRSLGELNTLADAMMCGDVKAMSTTLQTIDRWIVAVGDRRSLAEAEQWRCEAREKRLRAGRIRRQARDFLDRLPLGATAEQKAEGWAEEDRAASLLDDARRADALWLAAVHARRETLPDAAERLTDALLGWLAEADRAGEPEAIGRLESQLAAYAHDPRVEAALAIDVPVTFIWQTVGARVEIARYVERRRRLIAIDRIDLGTTGWATCAISHGVYRVRLITPDRIEARWPIHIRRNGSAVGRTIRLPDAPVSSLAPDEAYVAAGPCTVGGTDGAIDAITRRRVDIDGFIMRRRPETHGAYLAFLAALIASGRSEEAERYLPRTPPTVPDRLPPSLYVIGPHGGYALPPNGALRSGHPVSGITWFAARAYAEFEARRTGLPWRLPRELEWEKAARGVDGRACPWGHHLDEAFGNVVNSREGAAAPVLVDMYTRDFPDDVSPYGVEGLAGNMRTWCAEPWRRGGPRLEAAGAEAPDRLGRLVDIEPTADTLMVIRGAAWSTSRYHMRSANRYADKAGWYPTTAGIRLVRDLAPDRDG